MFWGFFGDVLRCFTCVSFVLCYMAKASVMGSLMSASLMPAAMKTGKVGAMEKHSGGDNGNVFMKLCNYKHELCLSLQGHFFELWNAEGRDKVPESQTFQNIFWPLIELWLPSYRGVGSRVRFNLMLHAVLFQILPDLAVIISFLLKAHFFYFYEVKGFSFLGIG